jgi:hypothetical protein
MHEPSDGVAEEVERQLQLALAAAAIAARRAIAARQHAIEQARRESEQAARAVQARIDAERLLATERLRPVFEPDWWETARPQEIADMWQEANAWRDPDQPAAAAATPTIFDHAAHRIRQEVRDRSGLDPTQLVTLAAVQELEHEHQAALAEQPTQPAELGADRQEAPLRGYDDPRRREQLRVRLVDAGVPEPAIEARTLADVGQAREAAEAASMPPATSAEPRRGEGARSTRELARRR